MRLSGKTDEFEQETGEPDSAPESDNARIFDLWLSCHTHDEIAEAVGYSRPSIVRLLDDFSNFVNERKDSLTDKIDDFSEETDEHEDTPEDDNERIFDMWMACYTQQEIAEA
jgi:hypothetical protein